MQFEKRQVRLGDIRPSEQNPREDFGDIGALARSIEATGGEPLNPPVVVADGNVYRIVDGERRYRALSSIYGEDREVSALVADTMDEANELVAMLATDDKRQLTEAERARGVQQLLVLGVDEQRIERASRATAGQIRAARKLRGSIEGRQVTLDQLEAASAFDDEKDIEAVLAAGDGWAGKADSIRRRVEREEAKAEDYDAFGDAGIPVVKEQPDGFTYKDWAHLGLVAAKLEDKEYPAGTVAVWNDRYWDFFAPKGGEDAEPEKTEEEIRAEQEAAPASPWTPCASSSSTPRCTAGSRRRKSGARSTTTSTSIWTNLEGRMRRMSSKKLKVTIERENVEPVEFEADALLCAGDTDDGVLFFAGGCMTQPIVLDIMRCFVSEVVRDMVKLGIDETEARGQVMLAAVSPSDASELLLDINLDDRDKIAHIAKELAASDLS